MKKDSKKKTKKQTKQTNELEMLQTNVETTTFH